MNRPFVLGFGVAVVVGVVGVFYLRAAPAAIVAEWSFAQCTNWLNCGNCLLGFMPDASCASGDRCIAFKGTATQHQFSLCTPTTDGNDHCEVDNSVNPDIWCQGFSKKCGCFDATTMTCPNAICDCRWGMMPDGATQFHVNATCQ